MTETSPSPPKLTLVADIYCGAVRGDFADEYMGVAGRVTQATLGFIPVIAQVCAARDFIADHRKGDGLGMFLNVLVFIPFIGGFAKVVLAYRSVRHVPGMITAQRSSPR